MRSYKNIFLAAAAMLSIFITSCSDFLTKEPQGNLTQNDFPVTADQALLATNACYSTLRNWYFHWGGYPILDIMSDDARKGSNPTDQGPTVGPYDNFAITTSQDGLDRWWQALYEGVKFTNVVILKVPDIDMDATLRNRYVGEAKFLRALYYFDLVRAWGDVPIVNSLTPDLHLPRSPRDSVYALIVSDLNFAINNLPERSEQSTADYGRATKGAAESLLSKVYIFMADLHHDQADWQNAATYAEEVINSQQYALDPDFGHTFSVDGQFNSESVFEIGAIGQDDVTKGGNQYGNTQGVRGTPNRGWGFNRPTPDLMHSFEPGDPRKDQSIIFLGEVLDGVTILGDGSTPDVTYDGNGDTVEIECYNQKVWTPGNDVATQWGANRRILRYAEVLLIAAEAENELGNSANALTYLNQVRARAREGNNSILPDITETDQTALRSIILHERRVELALEGDRFWDLVRTGNAPAVLGPLGFVTGRDELLPIPQNEIDISEGTLTQNPGW